MQFDLNGFSSSFISAPILEANYAAENLHPSKFGIGRLLPSAPN
jgi:hypothetical protein